MVKKRFSVSLDVKNSSSNRPIEVVEGDNGNEIEVVLTDDGAPVDLTGCRVLAIFSKSDGRTAQQDNDGHGIVMEEESEGRFTIALYTGSFSPGLVECEIQVLSDEMFTTLVTSAKFNFSCRRSIMNADTVKATDEYPILVDLIDRVGTAEAELADIAEDEGARQQAEQERRALAEKWKTVSAEAETLPAGTSAEVSVVLGEEGAAFSFGIPRGRDGDNSLPHAAQHAVDGDDAVTPASIGAASAQHTHTLTELVDFDAHTHSGSLRHLGERTEVLAASLWEGNAQTLVLEGVSADAVIEIGLGMSAGEEAVNAAASAMLLATEQSEGSITVTAFGAVPQVDIPVLLRIREVIA
ncbi:MAG: BppU family phage baseplate upper protein [Clostridia bacterium]|nr:BppU family phage baseplate upper protein [Clostridia bacterium]